MSAGEARALFRRHFQSEPSAVASAPARVNLIGEHTDYNGGEVLPIAIARRTFVALRATDGDRVRAVSATEERAGEFRLGTRGRAGEWWDYVQGVAAALRERGVLAPAFDVAVWSDIPAGAGLSSSAALEVAVALALLRATNTELAPRDVALLSHRAESEFVGVQSGIMDQFASALAREAHALHVWCDTTETEHVPMRTAVLVFDTAVPRSLRDSAFNTRRLECDEALALLRRAHPELPNLAASTPEQVRAACLPDPLGRRALHVAEETRRVRETVEVLRDTGHLSGELLIASHQSLRENYECSSPELDWFVERVLQRDGVKGARLTGAGWGGCAIAVGDHDALAGALPGVEADYSRRFGRTPRSWLTHARAGARLELDA